MKQKPITPTTHAIIDYAFGAIQIAAPAILGLEPKSVKTYAQLGTGLLAVTSATDTPITVQPAISMETHKKIDTALLVVQALMIVSPMIRKSKKTLIFHLGFMALAVANYMLTDYRTDPATSKLADTAGEGPTNASLASWPK